MRGIITADWHLRATRPRCRKDSDWMGSQRKVLRQIVDFSWDNDLDVFVVGDIFHSNSDASFECIWMVQRMAELLEKEDRSLYLLAGNHDLPFHNIDNLDRSAVGILLKSNNIYHICTMNGTVI